VTDAITELETSLPLALHGKRRRATVHWTDSEGAHAIPLERSTLLGSAEQAPLRVVDSRVSRLHAELELTDEGVTVRDVGSTNGTWLGAVRLELAHLMGDTILRVGSMDVRITFDAKPSTVPLWPEDHFGELLGRSEAMRELFLNLNQFSHSEAPVLIRGETGSGKELVASCLHALSKRAQAPFVVVDCAALSEPLLESELFGHVKGAFTGAVSNREGAFEAADGGTVFIDEIGELPLSMQPKLLRVLESHTVRRVGQNTHRRVDVRFVAATHRDLEAMVAKGQFREDLFFRLAVLPVHVPPLRERADDIPLLLNHFLKGRPVELAAAHREILLKLPWPGNVRELRTFAERLVSLGADRTLAMAKGSAPASSADEPRAAPVTMATGLPTLEVDVDVPFKDLRARWVDHLEREYIGALLGRYQRDVGAVAERAGLDRSYIHRLVRKHEL
jgi:transcriptional regulator with GAF, ATPase, and Fis domain